jgi:hypothetical protein
VNPEEPRTSQAWSFLGVVLPIAAVAGSLALAPALASRSYRSACQAEYGQDYPPLDERTIQLIDSISTGGTKCGYLESPPDSK